MRTQPKLSKVVPGLAVICHLATGLALVAAPLPRLKITENHRFLVTADGQPFFWLGDTAPEKPERPAHSRTKAYASSHRLVPAKCSIGFWYWTRRQKTTRRPEPATKANTYL